ncbi:hypothetical protein [Pseudoduganella umbonata]|uniref:Uncharacterized protein n=1 Tax=Pseudoduganella umbonata TaxID=864828 RepID=A0A4P8HLX5_9BURK|nr:hypothetical protein [Pseudoduganella umbonata]MBB3222747.1 hypothetical protein [Pseudoduganella umbonata]QCP10759.1 hypothetical protein FCL38_10200 [Pseudoduganella umbonata]
MAISATSALTSGVYTPTTTTVVRTGNPALAAKAASLSSTAGIVATLGGSSGAQVYSPAGLLNTLAQAGTAAALPGNTDTGNGTGTGNNASDLASSGQWAAILKANPSAAAFVIGASYTSGIIDTLA